MKKYNYITDLHTKIHEDKEIDVISQTLIPLELDSNPINRISIIIAKKKSTIINTETSDNSIFSCPIENKKLYIRNGYWISSSGSCYPEINGFPILKASHA
tara:strand:- start:58963 stop:59265 length:303 start_codon:yes stop_codon:yes gene_type:complete